uniref:Uncharacterized protein n=1 Tax=Helicotheca tamesis TaxID=374047 RepID=A0A7S2N434_9STRA
MLLVSYRRKIMGDDYLDDGDVSDEQEDIGLFKLLNFYPNVDVMETQEHDDAIIKEVQQNPRSAEVRYCFLSLYPRPCFPLYHALKLRAPVNVINALYFPTIQKEKDLFEPTALHIAVEFRSSLDVVNLILEKDPESVKEKTFDFGYTPLHTACEHGAPLEVVALLLSAWPDLVRETTTRGDTALHRACIHGASFEVISLLLGAWPDASKEKNMSGFIPLNLACRFDAPLKVLLLMLEKWLKATEYEITDDMESLMCDASGDVKEILTRISVLFAEIVDNSSKDEILSFFANIKWWNGVVLVLIRYPTVTRTIELETTVKADFLSMVGRRCKLKTMWQVICNEQDLFPEM